MKLLEYKAKDLFEKFGLPVKNGIVIDNLDGLEKKLADANISYPVVVKAQVQIGGRGKAGGIQFADDAAQVRAHCEKLLGMDLRGYRVNHLLIVEKAEVDTEWYLSIMLDRLTKCPLIIFSALGGIDIEDTAKTAPDKIVKIPIDPLVGIKDFHVRLMLSKANIAQEHFGQLFPFMQNLYRMFCEYDCMLAEINPLAVNANGLIALDGKVDIDDSALFRLPDILAFRDSLQEEELVIEARSFDFLYIPVEEGGSIAVASNGSGMLMSCIDLISKEGMKVGAALDLGGGATAERIKEAMRILFKTPGIKAVLINIFGGITRCDEVAGGVKLMMESGGAGDKIVVLRMEGTNKDKGLEIINTIQTGEIVSVPGLRESVAALAERRARL